MLQLSGVLRSALDERLGSRAGLLVLELASVNSQVLLVGGLRQILVSIAWLAVAGAFELACQFQVSSLRCALLIRAEAWIEFASANS